MIWPQMTTRSLHREQERRVRKKTFMMQKSLGKPVPFRRRENVERTAGIQVYHNRSLHPGDPGGKTEMHAGAR